MNPRPTDFLIRFSYFIILCIVLTGFGEIVQKLGL